MSVTSFWYYYFVKVITLFAAKHKNLHKCDSFTISNQYILVYKDLINVSGCYKITTQNKIQFLCLISVSPLITDNAIIETVCEKQYDIQ